MQLKPEKIFNETYLVRIKRIYFTPSSEFNAYLKQIKVILTAVKQYRTFSLVTNTIYMFSP